MFHIDPNAPRIELGDEELKLLSPAERQLLLKDSTEICSSIQDNDSEVWHLTAGGQFIRLTGLECENASLADPAYALETLHGFAAEEIVDQLFEANAFPGLSRPSAMDF